MSALMGGSSRQVAGCVPIRSLAGTANVQPVAETALRPCDQYEVLMVRSKYNPRVWLFPKGGVKRKESAKEAAIRETREEAGVEGTVLAKLGSWRAWSGEQHTMFLLRVDLERKPGDPLWTEYSERPRHWFRFVDAERQLEATRRERPELADMLRCARKAITEYEEEAAKKRDKERKKMLKKEQKRLGKLAGSLAPCSNDDSDSAVP
ncbi:hypothetical protein CCYA_CCYA07G2097 [Cyanidiococcus yangmingshanensis]|nr:hypothetical protein CCYA_CCYA07G2097 [Cyanidiococcus yangmingshanensis]